MRITQLTPGTGHFYCGNCLRDGALASALTKLGHDVTMIPLYLPIVDEEPLHDDSPIFLGGINMYLRHKLPMAAKMPGAIARILDAPGLLRWSSKRGDMTDAAKHANMMLAVLRGDEQSQRSEVDRLMGWMQSNPKPDVVCLCNALLTGMTSSIKSELGVPVLCTLHGEDTYIDALPEPARSQAWDILRERAAHVSMFIAVSDYYAKRMIERLDLDPNRVVVVHNGIRLDDIAEPPRVSPSPPTIGYLARMCPEKGLHTLIDAFIELKRRNTVPDLQLQAAGVVLKADRKFVQGLSIKLKRAGCLDACSFLPNITRAEKLRFLSSLTAFSVPATYGESFGLYILESLAHAVPVVQPNCGAFPEIIEQTGGGLLCEPDDPISLADQLERLLLDSDLAGSLGLEGHDAVFSRFGVDRMARDVAAVCERAAGDNLVSHSQPSATLTPGSPSETTTKARSHA